MNKTFIFYVIPFLSYAASPIHAMDNAQEESQKCLRYKFQEALMSKSYEQVLSLIQQGFDVNSVMIKASKNKHGDASITSYDIPINMALDRGAPAITRLLISNGASVDLEKNPDLLPKSLRYPSILEIILSRNDVTKIKKEIQTCLEALVRYNGKMGSIKTLIKYGADAKTPRLARLAIKSELSPQKFAFLASKGLPVGDVDHKGKSLLFSAVEKECSLGIIAAIIKAGADVNHQTKWGETAFARAARKKDIQALSLLLAHGADPLITTKKGVLPSDDVACWHHTNATAFYGAASMRALKSITCDITALQNKLASLESSMAEIKTTLAALRIAQENNTSICLPTQNQHIENGHQQHCEQKEVHAKKPKKRLITRVMNKIGSKHTNIQSLEKNNS